MTYYCTLFDSFYLNRGLVMYQSLKSCAKDFHLYIFAFDDVSLNILRNMQLDAVTVISLTEFENENLLAVKPGRSKGEYCWTCTPSTIDYCITRYNLPHCTYVDADLSFYSDPQTLLDEMNGASVLITEHRYTPGYDKSATSGIYCVQFVTFFNNADGLRVLHWWRDRCIEWCFARFEDGKFGDQKYLDDWPSRFPGVHVLQHIGGGVAPWNAQQYMLEMDGDVWMVRDVNNTGARQPLVFFHFHYLKFFDDATVDLSHIYKLGYKGVLRLYQDYVAAMLDVNITLKQRFSFTPRSDVRGNNNPLYAVGRSLYNRFRRVSGYYNCINASRFARRSFY